MKIAILGSRGIPNNYGGFEQFAEIVSQYFVKNGHIVTVYNPSDHPYREDAYRGVRIVRILSNEKLLKFLNVFIFDFLCLRHARRQKFDIILELGYHPAALFYPAKKNNHSPKILTHMAGMEWQRSKWGALTRKFIRYLEGRAVRRSDGIVSDNQGIKEYFSKEYGVNSYYLAYGAELFDRPDIAVLEKYQVAPYEYYMMVARFQNDNKIEMALDGYVLSGKTELFLVVGGHTNAFGTYLKAKYREYPAIRFIGGIYDYGVLCSLRWHAKQYFHVHSAGGTNPSLLEAMASNAYIAAYGNSFNRYVLKDSGHYFSTEQDVADIIRGYRESDRDGSIRQNRKQIAEEYQWDKVTSQYVECFEDLLVREEHNMPVLKN